ncbi:MAG: glutaredoxin family protein [Planctomycetaceae bacterium]
MSVLIFADRWTDVAIPFPGFWIVSRSIHVPLCLTLLVLGWVAHRRVPRDAGPLSTPAAFQTVRFYSKPDCPLCDEALEILSEFTDCLPTIEVVDISGHPQLLERFGNCIPVVEMNGRVRFRGRVSRMLLTRLIDAAGRAEQEGSESGQPSRQECCQTVSGASCSRSGGRAET